MNFRLLPDAMGMLMHKQLYDRMIAFASQYTPEIPAHPVINAWLTRFYSGDSNIHILVATNDEYKITGHVFIDIQEAHGYKIVFCHQAIADKGSTGSLAEGMEYIDKLRTASGAHCSIFTVVKNIKGLEKKYGYKTTRTLMVKYESPLAEGESNDTE